MTRVAEQPCAVICLVIAMLAVWCCDSNGSEEDVAKRMSDGRGADVPVVVITGISVGKQFPVPLVPEYFEQHLTAAGPDYVLEIHGASAEDILSFVEDASWVETDEITGTTRYRISSLGQGVEKMIYLTDNGEKVTEGKSYVLEQDTEFLEFWRGLLGDIVPDSQQGIWEHKEVPASEADRRDRTPWGDPVEQ